MNILLIIDVQNDFCDGGALAVDGGSTVVPIANKLASSHYFELKLATRFWNPCANAAFFNWTRFRRANAAGDALHPELLTAALDRVFLQGTNPEFDSASALIDRAGRPTELAAYIERTCSMRGVQAEKTVVTVCGLALDYSVGLTALDARKLGYGVQLALDGTRAVCLSPGDDLKMLKRIVSHGVGLALSREILKPSLTLTESHDREAYAHIDK